MSGPYVNRSRFTLEVTSRGGPRPSPEAIRAVAPTSGAGCCPSEPTMKTTGPDHFPLLSLGWSRAKAFLLHYGGTLCLKADVICEASLAATRRGKRC